MTEHHDVGSWCCQYSVGARLSFGQQRNHSSCSLSLPQAIFGDATTPPCHHPHRSAVKNSGLFLLTQCPHPALAPPGPSPCLLTSTLSLLTSTTLRSSLITMSPCSTQQQTPWGLHWVKPEQRPQFTHTLTATGQGATKAHMEQGVGSQVAATA